MTTEPSGTRNETLEQRLAREPLPSGQALEILKRLLKALAFRHWSGELHGGITPRTIVLSPDDRVTLIGGLLGDSSGAAPLPIPETPAYPGYLAPEQIGGLPADARTDVFAVAVIAYEMFTGANPFTAGGKATAREVMDRIAEGPVPRLPAALRARLPEQVVVALGLALSKNPDDRFRSAEGFLEALGGTSSQAQTGTARVSAPAPAPLPRKRSAAYYYGVPAILAVVTLVVVLAVVFSTRGSDAASETTMGSVATTTPAPTTLTTAPPTTTTEAPTTTTAAPTTTMPPTPVATRFEDDAPGLVFEQSWVVSPGEEYSGGRFVHANAAGASVTATFHGTSLVWIAKQSPAYGIAKVTLDGTTTATVDLYAADVLFQQEIWKTGTLSEGPHTVTIEWTGEKSDAATGANICVDAFDIVGDLVSVTRVEQADPNLDWTGTWSPSASDLASGGSFLFADESGAAVTIDFTGRALDLVAKKGPNYGQAKVTVDGTSTFMVDFYSAEVEWASTVWSSGLLPQGDHTVTIEWTGNKSDASTATNINVDALLLIGTLR